MSKESRRAARLARESRRAGTGASQPGGDSSPSVPPAAASGSTGVEPVRRTVAPAGPTRAGRRERVRSGPKASFLERRRSAIVTVAALAIVAVAVGYVFTGSSATAYTCTTQFDPSPTPALEPSSSARLGFLQDDMGNSHIVAPPQKYLFCPPASGNHYNATNLGPIAPRLYKPQDKVGPPNWIHNLEHGGLVVLYRNDSAGAGAAGQQTFQDYVAAFPESPICKVPPRQLAPVIARFDDMPHAFAALVWDRVFYLDSWDPALVDRFYLSEAERLDSEGVLIAPPEDVTDCKSRLASPVPSGAVAPSGSTAPSGSAASAVPSASASAVPSASASAVPSASASAAPAIPSVVPSASVQPSAAPS